MGLSLLDTFEHVNVSTPFALAVDGDLLYVGAQSGSFGPSELAIVDISDPTALALTGIEAGTEFSAGFATGVAVKPGEQRAFTAASNNAHNAFDVSDPADPALTHAINLGSAHDALLVGDRFYVTQTQTDRTVQVFSTAAGGFVAVNNVGAGGGAQGQGICEGGGGLVTCCHVARQIVVWDISTPDVPVLVGYLEDATNVHNPDGVAALGDLVVAVGDSYIACIDVSDPSTPALVGRLDPGFAAFGVLLEGTRAAVVGDATLAIVDISDPTDPTVVDSILFAGPSGTHKRVTGSLARMFVSRAGNGGGDSGAIHSVAYRSTVWSVGSVAIR